jgi:hypothetical protein
MVTNECVKHFSIAVGNLLLEAGDLVGEYKMEYTY